VPAEFRKQSPAVANPPTLMLLADAMATRAAGGGGGGGAVDAKAILRSSRWPAPAEPPAGAR
jgi:hypothetical protein